MCDRNECQQLEDYLDGDLPAEVESRFAAHLAECEACREAVEQQGWIDGLLQTAPTEQAPAEIQVTLTQTVARSRRRQFAYGATALAAAASLLFVFLKQPELEPTAEKPVQVAVAEHTEQSVVAEVAPVARFIGGEDVIVVQHESPFPNVTIVEIYPTVTAQRRRQQETPSINTPQQILGDPS